MAAETEGRFDILAPAREDRPDGSDACGSASGKRRAIAAAISRAFDGQGHPADTDRTDIMKQPGLSTGLHQTFASKDRD